MTILQDINIIAILTLIAVGISVRVVLRKVEEQHRRDREQRKNAAAK